MIETKYPVHIMVFGMVTSDGIVICSARDEQNSVQYQRWTEGKDNSSMLGVTLSPTPRCSSYWKGRLLVALD